jgi:hypothetical protein
MRTRLAILTLIAAIWAPLSPAATTQPTTTTSAPGKKFNLSISADSKVPVDRRIDLKLTFTNDSDEEVVMTLAEPSAIYEITVIGPDGKEQPQTQFGSRAATLFGITPVVLFPLRTGKHSEDQFHLNRRYDMSLEGDYTVKVRRTIRAGDERVVVESNTITIRVTGAED